MHSEDYQAQLLELRASRPSHKPWGTTGARNFGEYVAKYIKDHNGWIKSVLDYGCGTGSLGEFVQDRTDVAWTNYDPGVVEYSAAPELGRKFDLVLSSDVLEHIEPDMLAGTLEECSQYARKAQYHHIACEECGLTLPDGRNAHLSIHTPEEWYAMIEKDGWTTQYWTRELERKRGQLKLACKILVEK